MADEISRARAAEWDHTVLNGRQLAHICPICSAWVPVGNDVVGVAYRERHIRYHDREPR